MRHNTDGKIYLSDICLCSRKRKDNIVRAETLEIHGGSRVGIAIYHSIMTGCICHCR
jgi:hypothetical protein